MYVVCGAGGFIGGHLVKHLGDTGRIHVRAVDKKPLSLWHQRHDFAENLCLDLAFKQNCRRACEGALETYQLAANMGGIGFIETNRIECMYNVVVNANMLEAAYEAGVQRYLFASSACVYNADKQRNAGAVALKEQDAYPAMAERGYGWEKLYTEIMCQEYWAERGLRVFIPRFHNIYGPQGDWRGGREKAPAAICRKVIECKYEGNDTIDIWGDGTATRSFCWIGDCISGIDRIMHCDELVAVPVNLGSNESVSINQLVDIVEEIAAVKLHRRYDITAPKGVAGRNSDNTMIQRVLGWQPATALRDGLEKTYAWIEREYLKLKQ